MNSLLKGASLSMATCAFLGVGALGNAQAFVGVDPSSTWLGYMNVSDRPQDGGAFRFGSAWGPADLTATWGGGSLTLGPNSIGDPDPYWYQGGGAPGAVGNKIMDASMYVETTGVYSGQTLTFSGSVLNNTLVGNTNADGNGWTSVAFIKDFAPDYSSFVATTVALTPGTFSINLTLDADATRHIQYGFETIGPNVWATDVAPYGSIEIDAVPEPVSMFALGLGALAVARRRAAKR